MARAAHRPAPSAGRLLAARLFAALAVWGAGAIVAHAAVFARGPADGTLLCSGRGGARIPVAALADGGGGFLVVTRDPRTNMVDVPDGGDDIGLVRLDGALLPIAGADPCGDLLVGGTGHQTPFTAFALSSGRFVVLARERALDPGLSGRVFAWGFDASGRAIFTDIMVAPADPFPVTDFPFGAPDGAGGFFIGWQEHTPGEPITGRVLLARYEGSGRTLWPAPVAVSAGALALAAFSVAVADGRGGVFVSWQESVSGDPAGYQPRVQHLDAAGAPTLPAGGVRLDPARAVLGPVTLAPWRPPVPGGASGVVALALAGVPRAHLILDDGTRPWGVEGVALSELAGLRPKELHSVVAPDGSLRVTWIEADGVSPERLMATRLERDGRTPWPGPVALLESGGISGRSEAMTADGSLAVAATVIALDPRDALFDLVAQVIDARGRLRTSVPGFDLCRADRTQTNPLLWPAAAGAAGAIWSDERAGIGLDGADNYFTQSMAWTSAPRLEPGMPAPVLRQGRSIVVQLQGDDLQPGLIAAAGAGLAVTVVAVDALADDAPGDRLTLAIRAEPDAPIGRHALRIVNPDGGSTTAAEVEVTLDPARIDIDGSGRADGFDLVVLAGSFGRATGDPGYARAADIDGSGLVDGLDLALLAARFGDRVLQ